MTEFETFRVDNAELCIPVSGLNARLRQRLQDGGYEHFERDLARAHLKAGDRVLDLGAGAGMVAIVAARIVGAENVTTVEANPEMLGALRGNLDRNGAEGVRLCAGAVVGPESDEETVVLNLRQAFWSASTCGPLGKDPRLVEVPALRFGDLLRESNATALTMDIEGAEADALSEPLPDQIRLIILELHPGIYGERVRNDILRNLTAQGFRNLQARRTEEVYALGREVAGASA